MSEKDGRKAATALLPRGTWLKKQRQNSGPLSDLKREQHLTDDELHERLAALLRIAAKLSPDRAAEIRSCTDDLHRWLDQALATRQ